MKAYKLVSTDIAPGRNGQKNYTYVVSIKRDNNGFKKYKSKVLYTIFLTCEYVRINKEGKTEYIYRCTVISGTNGYRIYSGFEHPKSSIDYFLKKAKVIPQ